MNPRRGLLALAGLVALSGCQLVWGFESFSQGGGGSDAGSDSGGGATCLDPSSPPEVVGVRVSTGACVFIDKNEITVAEYAAMLAHPPATPPTRCALWNTNLGAPEEQSATQPCTGPGEARDAGAPAVDPNDPVTCVDYCDALTYCESKGKILCAGTYNVSNAGPWYDVCSANNANEYPYGPAHQANYCNDSSNTVAAGALEPVGTMNKCVTAQGVNDLVGNASEWVDECSDVSKNAQCEVRGGSALDSATGASCKAVISVKPTMGLAQLGFRCCWKPGK